MERLNRQNYIPPEMIQELKKIDLITYLQMARPDELRQVGKNYFSRTHDSLCISSNGLWHWQSQHIGGTTALQYLMKVCNMTFLDAANHLMKLDITPCLPLPNSADMKPHDLQLPPPNTNNDAVIRYLRGRGVHRAIIDHCIQAHTLYQGVECDKRQRAHHNAVFVGYDQSGIPRYGFIRGLGKEKFARDVSGSDKSYSFAIPTASGNTLIKCEAAVDALSLATLAYLKDPTSWQNYHYLSGGGASDFATEQYLADHPEITAIRFCNDNDDPGRKIAAREIEKYGALGYVVSDTPPPRGKDYNDYLKLRMAGFQPSRFALRLNQDSEKRRSL